MKYNVNKKSLSPEERKAKIKQMKIESGELPTIDVEVDSLKSVSSALLGGVQADEVTAAKQINKALCMFANTLPEDEAMKLAGVFPEWESGVKYKPNEYLRHGLNHDGEPQIYRTVSEHVSDDARSPEKASSLFRKIGFAADGTPKWVQPMGYEDSYEKGDRVSHDGTIYISNENGNIREPGVGGWLTEKEAAAANLKPKN